MSQVSLISHHIREHATGDDADGSLYVGPAGIAFAFYHKAMNFQVLRILGFALISTSSRKTKDLLKLKPLQKFRSTYPKVSYVIATH